MGGRCKARVTASATSAFEYQYLFSVVKNVGYDAVRFCITNDGATRYLYYEVFTCLTTTLFAGSIGAVFCLKMLGVSKRYKGVHGTIGLEIYGATMSTIATIGTTGCHVFLTVPCNDTIATSHYINAFSGALGRDNFFGTQFHPEKSGAVGAQILKNFLEL